MSPSLVSSSTGYHAPRRSTSATLSVIRAQAVFVTGFLLPRTYGIPLNLVMVEIGQLVQLQIQRSSLKTGEKPNRVYDPAPLLSVDELWVTPDGVLGLDPNGSWL